MIIGKYNHEAFDYMIHINTFYFFFGLVFTHVFNLLTYVSLIYILREICVSVRGIRKLFYMERCYISKLQLFWTNKFPLSFLEWQIIGNFSFWRFVFWDFFQTFHFLQKLDIYIRSHFFLYGLAHHVLNMISKS